MQRGYYSVFTPYAKSLITEYDYMLKTFPGVRPKINKDCYVFYSGSEAIDYDTKVKLAANLKLKKLLFKTTINKSYRKHNKTVAYKNGKVTSRCRYVSKNYCKYSKHMFIKLGWFNYETI